VVQPIRVIPPHGGEPIDRTLRAAPREARSRALARQNDARRLIVGRDHFGAGGCYSACAAPLILFEHAFSRRECSAMAPYKTCLPGAADGLTRSGAQIPIDACQGEPRVAEQAAAPVSETVVAKEAL
jgi:hypothetical protein